MIYRTKNGIHVQMGAGDVFVGLARWPSNEAQTLLSFHQPGKTAPVGTEASAHDLVSAGPPAVVVEFTCAESIDVVISALTQLKEQFQTPSAAGPMFADLVGEWSPKDGA